MRSKPATQLLALFLGITLAVGALIGCAPPVGQVNDRTATATGIVTGTATAMPVPPTHTPSPTQVSPTATPEQTVTIPATPTPAQPTPVPTTPVPPTPTSTPQPWVTLVKGPGDPVYLVVEGVERRWFPNSQSFEAFTQEYGLGWNDIKSYKDFPELWRQTCRLPCGEPMPHYYPIPRGSLVRGTDSPEIYVITNEQLEGVKRQVKVLASDDVDEDQVACVSQDWLDEIPGATP
jgi:hypothetical protein